jgi:hypothetical protein
MLLRVHCRIYFLFDIFLVKNTKCILIAVHSEKNKCKFIKNCMSTSFYLKNKTCKSQTEAQQFLGLFHSAEKHTECAYRYKMLANVCKYRKKLVEQCTNISQTGSVFRSEVYFGAIHSAVMSATCQRPDHSDCDLTVQLEAMFG